MALASYFQDRHENDANISHLSFRKAAISHKCLTWLIIYGVNHLRLILARKSLITPHHELHLSQWSCVECNLSLSPLVSVTSFFPGIRPVTRPYFRKDRGEPCQLQPTQSLQYRHTVISHTQLWVSHIPYRIRLIYHFTCSSVCACQFWAWFVVLLVELCVPVHSMPASFFLHRWCPLVCIKSPSPSPCLCFPLPSPPLSLFTQECVICGSADRVCDIPAELWREGRTGKRWWKTTPLPPPLTHPSSPLSPRPITHLTYFYDLSPPCRQTLLRAHGLSGRIKDHTDTCCIWFLWMSSRGDVSIRECWPSACISSLKSI